MLPMSSPSFRTAITETVVGEGSMAVKLVHEFLSTAA
jgi:hypothetical protein